MHKCLALLFSLAVALKIVAIQTQQAPLSLHYPHLGQLPGPVIRLGLHPDGSPDYGVNATHWDFFTKIRLLHEWLTSQTNPDELIIFVDARDVIWGGCRTNLTQVYYELTRNTTFQIIFGAELGCWPRNTGVDCANYYIPEWVRRDPALHPNALAPWHKCNFECSTPPYYKHLNSGGFMGPVGALMQMVASALHTCPVKDDQQCYYHYYRQHPHRVTLDYRAQIWLNMCHFRLSTFLPLNGSFHNHWLGAPVCFLHANGGAKRHFRVLLPQVARQLGRDTQLRQCRALNLCHHR
eukprot:NODE_3752_length_907_cov_29.374359_g3599_i0.p1 GENE.NODE_3752_length_907_cov_29.374359_g3599_i0~~NODE_3752_length_907_cov_29.374359_g3599_i0.p1  ORF type:complete len:294 (+),score=49.05 NODE_3752_length_907_cov_29.374359_g3599_i0:1-882(+)